MFEGFKHLRVPTKEAEIDNVAKDSGPPLLLIGRTLRGCLATSGGDPGGIRSLGSIEIRRVLHVA